MGFCRVIGTCRKHTLTELQVWRRRGRSGVVEVRAEAEKLPQSLGCPACHRWATALLLDVCPVA